MNTSSILSKLKLPTNVGESIAAAKAAELETEDRSAFPELEIKEGETKTISILPGCGGWVEYAVASLDDATEESVMAFVEGAATKQLAALGIDGDAPEWAMIPAAYHAAHKVSGLFVPKLGNISYAKFPATVLDKLPADHPRKLALTIKGKFGLPKVKHQILMYCVEHPVGKRGLDDAELEKQIHAGGFVKLLRINMPTYAALKEAKAAMIQMGKADLTSVHLVVTLSDPKFARLGFQVNPATPLWNSPDLLKLVLQEVHKLGPVATKSPFREVSNEEFATGVAKAIEAAKPADAPAD